MKKISRKMRILKALQKGWRSNYYLVMHYGVSALTRVRELRASGHKVIKFRKSVKGNLTNTWLYRVL